MKRKHEQLTFRQEIFRAVKFLMAIFLGSLLFTIILSLLIGCERAPSEPMVHPENIQHRIVVEAESTAQGMPIHVPLVINRKNLWNLVLDDDRYKLDTVVTGTIYLEFAMNYSADFDSLYYYETTPDPRIRTKARIYVDDMNTPIYEETARTHVFRWNNAENVGDPRFKSIPIIFKGGL